jgi:hypothetical protein
VLEPRQGPAKKWKASGSIFAVTGMRASAFPAKPEAKALDGAYAVSLLGDQDKVLARVRVGAVTKDGKRRYAAADGGKRIAEIEKTSVEELPKSVEDLLEPPPAPASRPDGGAPLQASSPVK